MNNLEIKVGEYVRTKNGEIAIFRGYNERKASQWIYKLEFQKRKFPKYCAEGYIVKHSKSIIDLIEIGDLIKYYSNNSGVDVIEEVLGTCKVDEDYDKGKGFVCTMLDDYIWSNDIKSIVTKEQFSNMEYRL